MIYVPLLATAFFDFCKFSFQGFRFQNKTRFRKGGKKWGVEATCYVVIRYVAHKHHSKWINDERPCLAAAASRDCSFVKLESGTSSGQHGGMELKHKQIM